MVLDLSVPLEKAMIVSVKFPKGMKKANINNPPFRIKIGSLQNGAYILEARSLVLTELILWLTNSFTIGGEKKFLGIIFGKKRYKTIEAARISWQISLTLAFIPLEFLCFIFR